MLMYYGWQVVLRSPGTHKASGFRCSSIDVLLKKNLPKRCSTDFSTKKKMLFI